MLGDARRPSRRSSWSARRLERDPAMARAVVAAGHEIGSHTMDHLDHDTVPVERARVGGHARRRGCASSGCSGASPSCTGRPTATSCRRPWPRRSRAGWTCVGWSVAGRGLAAGRDGGIDRRRACSTDLEPGAIVRAARRPPREARRPSTRCWRALGIVLAELPQRALAAGHRVGELLGPSCAVATLQSAAMAQTWQDVFLTATAPRREAPDAERAAGGAAGLLPAPAREPLAQPRGAGGRAAGDVRRARSTTRPGSGSRRR